MRIVTNSRNLRAALASASAIAALTAATAPSAWAKTLRATNVATLESMTGQLVAGDTLKVAPGNYDVDTWNLRNMKGTADKWISLIAEPGAVIRSADGCCNLVQFGESAYIRFKGFELTMAEQNPGIDGINVSGSHSHHLRFENLKIHAMTGNGISVFSNLADNLELVNSEIARIEGTGMYWGYPGRDIVSDILVQGNYIHHCPVDPNQETDYGFQFKGWGHRARILNNVFHDVGGTARSGLIVYYGKKPLAGDSPADVNIVAGNVLWNCRNEGITVMSDAVVENNIVWSAVTGINIQTYSDESFSGSSAVENLRVRNNTVFRCQSACINVSGWANAAATVFLTGNAAYQTSATAAAFSGSAGKGVSIGNVAYGAGSITGLAKGTGLGDFLQVLPAGQPPSLDFYPSAASPLREVLDAANCPETDFNGAMRPKGSKCDAGAYEADGAVNPGWVIKAGFKAADPASTIKKPAPVPGRQGKAGPAESSPARADGRATAAGAFQARFRRPL